LLWISIEPPASDACVCRKSSVLGLWQNVTDLARTALELNANLAPVPRRSFKRLAVMVGRNSVYGKREPMRAHYKDPIWIRLSFHGRRLNILVRRTSRAIKPRKHNSSV
jgi:hypothetical protein